MDSKGLCLNHSETPSLWQSIEGLARLASRYKRLTMIQTIVMQPSRPRYASKSVRIPSWMMNLMINPTWQLPKSLAVASARLFLPTFIHHPPSHLQLTGSFILKAIIPMTASPAYLIRSRRYLSHILLIHEPTSLSWQMICSLLLVALSEWPPYS